MNDRYYIKNYLAKELVEIVTEKIKEKSLFFIDPNAGNGAFLTFLLQTDGKVSAYDKNPTSPYVIKADFFNLVQKINEKNDETIVVIGHPPFGKNNDITIQFFNEAAKYSSYIAFVLPYKFNQIHIAKKLNPYFHLIYEKKLPQNSFEINGKDHDVSCVFCIYKKENKKRKLTGSENNCIEITTPSHAEFAVRKTGKRIGEIFFDENLLRLNIQHNYYCIALDESLLGMIKNKNIKKVEITSGQKILSKQELFDFFEQKSKKI